MKFKDLEFKAHPCEGIMAIHKLGNGYYVSVVKNSISYGGKQGLYDFFGRSRRGKLNG